MPERNNRSTLLLICTLLVAGTAGIYWRVCQHDFINYDDPDYVLENPQVQAGLNWHSIAWAFTTGHAGNWHPLTWLSHMLDWQFYGANAGGHHATSAVFHILNVVLLFLLLRELTGATWRSGMVAALFAWHPLHVESVAWISERKDVLSTLFFILTLWAYSQYVKSRPAPPAAESAPVDLAGKKKGWRWYAVALVLFSLGLMAKPMLVTLPFLLLLLDYWPFKRLNLSFGSPLPTSAIWRLVAEKAPFFVLAAASCIMTFLMQQRGGAVARMENVPFQLRLCNALVAYAQYLRKTLWPGDLAPFYPLPESYPVWPVALAAFLLLGITALVLRPAGNKPYLPVGWFWFLGTLVPVIGIVQVGNQALADRYSYIPLVGIFVMAAWGTADWLQQRPSLRTPAAVIWAVGLAAFGIGAAVQCGYWKNSETLFRHALKVTSGNYIAHHSLGTALVKAGRVAEAKPHFAAAVQAKPLYARAQSDFGLALVLDGKIDEGIDHYRVAIGARPDLAKPHYNLACALSLQGKPQEAIPEYQEALRLEPENAEARAALGAVLAEAGQYEQAAGSFKELVRLTPADWQAHFNLGRILKIQGKAKEAAAHLSVAARLNPENPDVLETLGVTLAEGGDTTNARIHLQHAVERRPSALLHYELGLCYVMQGDRKTAAEYYRLAIKAAPRLAIALNDLAWILATAPEPELRNGAEAVRLAEQACSLTEEKEARFLGTLDAAYAEADRFEDAIRTCKKTESLAQNTSQSELALQAGKRMQLYLERKAFRER
jgi:protein O-mannosyl-transferase